MMMRGLADDSGSIAPLAIGLTSVLLATTFTFANSSALLLFQQRQTQSAEALALAVDSALTNDELANDALLQAQAALFAAEAGITHFEVVVNDGQTVTAKVCGAFSPPIEVPIVGSQGTQAVCAEAKARRF